MGKKLTQGQTEKKFRNIVNTRGHEYVYEAPCYEGEDGELVPAMECNYSDFDGKPSCIVGVLLSEVAPEAFERLYHFEWESGRYYEPNVLSSTDLMQADVDLSDYFEDDAIPLIHAMQRKQDFGHSWGEALDNTFKETQ